MSKLHDIPLSVEMEAALLEWLDAMPADGALALRNLLPGGFRDPRLIRERLRAMIQGKGPLPGWLLEVIRHSLPACPGIAALSVAALRQHFDLLLAAAGPAQFLVALALDERPGVQKLALERLPAASQVISDGDKNAALDLWMETVDSSFVQLAGLKLAPPADETDPSPIHPEDAKRLEKRTAEQAETIAQLRSKLDKERAARAEDRRQLTNAAKGERERLGAEINQLKGKISELHRQIAALEQSKCDLEREKQDSIQAGIQSELRSVERKWLAEAIALESALSGNSTADLLLHVESVLEAQTRQDRHSGNRQELGRRLQLLRDAGQRLRDARQNALHPIRELAPIAEQVAAEIARLESQLSINPGDGIGERLLQEINESADFAALHECAGFVDSLLCRGVLPPGQSRRFHEALHRRHAILAAQPFQAGRETHTHWLSFPTLVHRNLDCLLLLDGHNVLFALDHLQPYFENGKPGGKARERLVEVVRNLVASRPKVSARIVFDSPTQSVGSVCPNLKVEFSGGQGDHRADDAIVRHLTQKDLHELKLRTFVVTNDRDLQARIRHLRAHYMPIGAFDLTLHDFHCLG